MRPETHTLIGDPFSPLKLQNIDESHMIYGNFIGVQYVFETALDPLLIGKAFNRLLKDCPYLAGRYDRKNLQIIPSPDGVPLRIQGMHSGSATDFSEIGTEHDNRPTFINEPNRKDVFNGRASLTTLTLTPLQNGGTVLGFAVNHLLVDAAGFHLIAARLADIYSSLVAQTTPPPCTLVRELDVFCYGTEQSRKQALGAVEKMHLPKPVKIRGPVAGLVRQIIMTALDRMMSHKRVVIKLSANDVARLKEIVHSESGEDWISTNIALCAHFTRIMAAFMFEDTPKTHLMIGQLLDLRGRYFEDRENQQLIFTGNAILIDTEGAEFSDGLQYAPRGEIARFFKQKIAKLNASDLRGKLNVIEDCLAFGYTYPGLDLKNPMIALNNQTKMNVYGLEFAGQPPLRVIPQDVGDNIMFFPTPDGGIEVYLRDVVKPARQKELASPGWRDRIMDF